MDSDNFELDRIDVVQQRLSPVEIATAGCAAADQGSMPTSPQKYCFTVNGKHAVYLWNGRIHIDSEWEPSLQPGPTGIGHTLVLKRRVR